MTPTLREHLAAIEAGSINRSNVIGLRKALNTWDRASRGYSTSRTAPRVTDADADALIQAIWRHKPRVAGGLHDSGLKVLRNPRYRKRWTRTQQQAIDCLDHFRLVDFEDIGRGHYVPVYEAHTATQAAFRFRNVPWQSGGDGPEIVED